MSVRVGGSRIEEEIVESIDCEGNRTAELLDLESMESSFLTEDASRRFGLADGSLIRKLPPVPVASR
jgi:hypothetical protein